MDHGTLTDNNGRKADFRNVTIIMTTNTGAAGLTRSTIGFSGERQTGRRRDGVDQADVHAGVRNRLDATISFGSLDHDVILKVVDKFLLERGTSCREGRAVVHAKLKAFLAAEVSTRRWARGRWHA
jgi:ATP-dependent Clp protease ATP-binding subunit ClpA